MPLHEHTWGAGELLGARVLTQIMQSHCAEKTNMHDTIYNKDLVHSWYVQCPRCLMSNE